jgi:hypothetical protein
MAVLVTAEVQGRTQQDYDGMFGALADGLRPAPGFILHAAHPVEGGWRVIEVWESKADANQYFEKQVAPHMPAGLESKRWVQPLHRVLKP